MRQLKRGNVLVVGCAVALGCSDAKVAGTSSDENRETLQPIAIEGEFLGGGEWEELDPQWNAGAGSDGRFVDIVAATRMAGGVFAVLDRFNKTVTFGGPGGDLRAFFGREGDGPAEFKDPRDVVALEGHVLVWDLGQQNLELFSDDGTFIQAVRLPEPGDLASLSGRIDLELADLSRRMGATSSKAVVFVQVEEDERDLVDPGTHERQEVQRKGYIVAYDPSLSAADTLISFDAASRSLFPTGPSSGPPIFSPEYIWGVGTGGILAGSSNSHRLRLADFSGRMVSELTWEGMQRAVSSADRLAHVRSFYREQSPYLPSNVREEWEGNASLREQAAKHIVVADSTPVFSRVWVAGRCAAVAPFDPLDASDGVAQRVAFVSLEDGSLAGRVAFGEPGSDRALWVSAWEILTRHIDSLGVQSVSKFQTPEAIASRCGSTGFRADSAGPDAAQ